MINQKLAQEFARDWIDSWNSHDLERILSHYSDDFQLTSPFIALFGGEASGVLKRKEKVAQYWKNALEKMPDLKFELIDVLYSVNSLVIYYRAVLGKKGAEVFFFGDDGKAIASIAHYDEL
ncbi:nuclear transport factor 2 family protein [Candidatus Gracilibacteria bacterium]|nr:nuclear transport factor 2 family protein [Candidatus Gracilibacteria bacterium]